MYPIFVYTSMIFYEFIDIRTTKYDRAMEHCSLYKLLILKNHMTLSLSIVETVNCLVGCPAEMHCTTVFALRNGQFSRLGGLTPSVPLCFVPESLRIRHF